MERRACGIAVVVLFFLLPLQARGEQYYLYSPKAMSPDEQGRTKDDILVRDVPIQRGDTLYGISRKFSGHGSYYPQILLFNDLKNPNLIYAGTTLRVPLNKDKTAEAGETLPPHAAKGKMGKHKKSKTARARAATPEASIAQPRKKQPSSGATPPVVQAGELSISDLKKLEGGREKKQDTHKKGTTAVHVRAKNERHEAKTPVGAEPSGKVGRTVRTSTPAAEESAQRLYAQALKAYRQENFRTALELFDRFLVDYAGSPQAADASLYKADCYMKLAGQ